MAEVKPGDRVKVTDSPYYNLPNGAICSVHSVNTDTISSRGVYVLFGGYRFWLKHTECILVEDDPKENSALDRQVGGNHYKLFAIQPAEFCYANRKVINNLQAEAISYICRAPLKNGKDDIKKAIHTLEIWMDLIDKEEKSDLDIQGHQLTISQMPRHDYGGEPLPPL